MVSELAEASADAVTIKPSNAERSGKSCCVRAVQKPGACRNPNIRGKGGTGHAVREEKREREKKKEGDEGRSGEEEQKGRKRKVVC